MTEKKLKHLSRRELLAMLIEQMEENEKLKTRINKMEEQLDSRKIIMNEAGSIAEAAMQLSGVFEAAQDAADRYLENIRRMAGEQECVNDLARQDGEEDFA